MLKALAGRVTDAQLSTDTRAHLLISALDAPPHWQTALLGVAERADWALFDRLVCSGPRERSAFAVAPVPKSARASTRRAAAAPPPTAQLTFAEALQASVENARSKGKPVVAPPPAPPPLPRARARAPRRRQPRKSHTPPSPPPPDAGVAAARFQSEAHPSAASPRAPPPRPPRAAPSAHPPPPPRATCSLTPAPATPSASYADAVQRSPTVPRAPLAPVVASPSRRSLVAPARSAPASPPALAPPAKDAAPPPRRSVAPARADVPAPPAVDESMMSVPSPGQPQTRVDVAVEACAPPVCVDSQPASAHGPAATGALAPRAWSQLPSRPSHGRPPSAPPVGDALRPAPSPPFRRVMLGARQRRRGWRLVAQVPIRGIGPNPAPPYARPSPVPCPGRDPPDECMCEEPRCAECISGHFRGWLRRCISANAAHWPARSGGWIDRFADELLSAVGIAECVWNEAPIPYFPPAVFCAPNGPEEMARSLLRHSEFQGSCFADSRDVVPRSPIDWKPPPVPAPRERSASMPAVAVPPPEDCRVRLELIEEVRHPEPEVLAAAAAAVGPLVPDFAAPVSGVALAAAAGAASPTPDSAPDSHHAAKEAPGPPPAPSAPPAPVLLAPLEDAGTDAPAVAVAKLPRVATPPPAAAAAVGPAPVAPSPAPRPSPIRPSLHLPTAACVDVCSPKAAVPASPTLLPPAPPDPPGSPSAERVLPLTVRARKAPPSDILPPRGPATIDKSARVRLPSASPATVCLRADATPRASKRGR